MIQTFATQYGSQLAGILTTVGLLKDLQFVIHKGKRRRVALATTSGLAVNGPMGEAEATRAAVVPTPPARWGSRGSPWLTCGIRTTENRFLLEARLFML